VNPIAFKKKHGLHLSSSVERGRGIKMQLEDIHPDDMTAFFD
jgi:hypothetical protein